MPISVIIVTVLVCYFLGNHNGAICVSHMLHDDVRDHGSGNAGLTNFIRNYGNSRAALVILIDVLKAVLACWLGALLCAPYGYALEGKVLAGVAVMVGHDFPALLGFRGGKGILSGWFIAWMIDWRVGLLIAMFPLVKKYLKPKIVNTNVDAVIGSRGYVTENIDNMDAVGQVKLGGMYWTARSEDGNPIAAGTLVQVTRIEGVKAFVTAVKAKEEVR